MVTRPWTLSTRLGAGIGLTVMLLGLVLGVAGYTTLSGLLERHLRDSAESRARQLALFGADAILSYDYATLERYASALAREPDIVAVRVTRDDGELLASAGDTDGPGMRDASALIAASQSLHLGGSRIGSVQLWVDRGGMEASLRRLAVTGLVLLLGLIALLFWLLRHFVERSLIRPVQALALAANPLAAQQCPEPGSLPAELAQLSTTFHQLCASIQAHLNEREHAERLARAATERLTREQRLATVGQLVAGLAHKLNTPLGSIRGFAQLLSERSDDPRQRRQADLIIEQAEACATTVRNLLDSVHPGSPQARDFDLHAHLQGTVELMQPLLHKLSITILLPDTDATNPDSSTTSPDCRYTVTADPAGVEQILFNLLSNAIDAGADHVTLRLGERHQYPYGALWVCDDGAGIAPDAPSIAADLAERLFDPFITAKPPGQGTGLGLYLSRQLATAMGARLELSDHCRTPGACFALTFSAPTSHHPTH